MARYCSLVLQVEGRFYRLAQITLARCNVGNYLVLGKLFRVLV